MPEKDNRGEYIKHWEKENYDRILLRLPKGYKTVIGSILSHRESLNGYLRELVDADLEKRGLLPIDVNKK